MTGLNTDFILQNGRFQLTSDAPKAFNCLWFLMNYDLQRVYMEDYAPGFEGLVQKNTSYVLQNQTLILGNLSKLIAKYVKNITVLGVDMFYTLADRKQYFVAVDHQYIPDASVATAIAFVG